jgi:hypothetical protein
MAKKAKKRKRARKPRTTSGLNHYWTLKVAYDGLIVGAWSPDQDLCGTISDKSDIKLKKLGGQIYVHSSDGITFNKCDEHGTCVWKKISGQWKCV